MKSSGSYFFDRQQVLTAADPCYHLYQSVLSCTMETRRICWSVFFVFAALAHTNVDCFAGRSFRSRPSRGNGGRVCDTRTALAEIGCDCWLIGEKCRDYSSRCVQKSGESASVNLVSRNTPGLCQCLAPSTYSVATKMCENPGPLYTTPTIGKLCGSVKRGHGLRSS